MYKINEHIATLNKKGEDWAVKNLERIVDIVGDGKDLPITEDTVHKLTSMIKDMEYRRDTLNKFSIDYQAKWSSLSILKTVRHLVNKSLGEKKK